MSCLEPELMRNKSADLLANQQPVFEGVSPDSRCLLLLNQSESLFCCNIMQQFLTLTLETIIY